MYNISLSQFKSFFPDAPVSGLEDDFCIMDVNLSEKHSPFGHPCRFDSFMVIYCLSGHIKINVNLEEYELKENMLFLNFPGNVIRVNEMVGKEDEQKRYMCVLMSKEFIGGLMLEINRILTQNMSMMRSPSICLTSKEQELLSSHINLMTALIGSDVKYKGESVRSLLASMFYMLVDAWQTKVDSQSESMTSSSRSKMVFDQFIKLVSEYHTQYHNVGFYADKLCLTPKYLSRVVRDASGKSAPEWIDEYVILEAKNLLKYSDDAIKEIVYKLHFPNQSVFYKFFKARTGMTPSEYRNL